MTVAFICHIQVHSNPDGASEDLLGFRKLPSSWEGRDINITQLSTLKFAGNFLTQDEGSILPKHLQPFLHDPCYPWIVY